jgi:hypothetical protein
MIELPTTKVKAETKSPERLIIFSAPKAGKTTILSQLENNLIIDLEDGTKYVDAFKVKASSLADLKEIATAISEANKKAGKFVYKYGTIDTVTALEDMVMPLAVKLYQQTAMGSKFTGTNILTLPNGAGYLYMRNAFEMIVKEFEGLFERLILVGHLKEKFIQKADKEVEAKAIDLTGKLSSITSSKADAIGYLYRQGKEVRINFTSSEGVICGARPEHLRGQDIVISEEIDGKILTHWDRIFVD